MAYAVILNSPGYLPDDMTEDLQRFETAREAWECIADRVEVDVQDLLTMDEVPQSRIDALANLVTQLRLETEPGTVYGPLPGTAPVACAYNVEWVEETP